MGVDYIANFGIGFEIEIDENNPPDLTKYGDSLSEYLYEKVDCIAFKVMTLGSCYYKNGTYHAVILNPHLPLKEVAEKYNYYESELRKFLQQNHLKPTSEFDVVGGLYIC